MTIGLVVEVHELGLRMTIFLVSGKVFEGAQMREGFHSELAVESSAEGVEDLVFLLGTMPH